MKKDINRSEQKSMFLERLNNVYPKNTDIHLSISKSESEIVYNTNKVYIAPEIKYIVRCFIKKDVFVVWDYSLHRNPPGGKNLNLSIHWNNSTSDKDAFYCFYKFLGHKEGIEKVCLIGMNRLEEFFNNIDAYMSLNDQDDDFKYYYNPLSESEKSHVDEIVNQRPLRERQIYSCTRKTRDEQFRKAVLDAYGHRCAVCRTDIEAVLQAAHERGHEAASTVYDDPNHGICLCANHHLMYDKGLIDINLSSLNITIHDERLCNTIWYQEFMRNGGKIIERSKE